TKDIQSLLESYQIDGSRRPDMRSLRFVQIDEFYPMDSRQHNSFHYYVNEFYIKGFGLNPAFALLIDATSLGLPPGRTMEEMFPDNVVDLTLRVRQTRTDLERSQKDVINRVDVFCMEYESKIREMGGIGFFLGGIGPDGHIAFNVRGSSVYSVTRLTGTNYETQAAAATDLGGIEISRSRLVITIGLSTITYNPTCTAIIIAAGDAKAGVVGQAIQEKKGPQFPASVLQDLPNARFYITKGAAKNLVERRFEDLCSMVTLRDGSVEDAVVTLALAKGKAVTDLTQADFESDRFAREVLKKTGTVHHELMSAVRQRMVEKIDRGIKHVSNTTFLHTEPHHDDIMLAYIGHIYHLVRDPSNQHYFGNVTSGFTSVSNLYTLSILRKVDAYLERGAFSLLISEGYFDPASETGRMQDVYLYLDGQAARSQEMKDEA
ncbi:MAG: glucosamine-6-phosphate deaminase, partial [Bacteroidota bacterium]